MDLKQLLNQRKRSQNGKIIALTVVCSIIIVALFSIVIALVLKFGLQDNQNDSQVGNDSAVTSPDTDNRNNITNNQTNTSQPNSSTVMVPNYDRYLAATKTLYTWSHSFNKRIDGLPNWVQLIQNHNNSFDNYVDFLTAHNFKKVYLFAGSVEWDWEGNFQNQQLPYHYMFVSSLKKLQKHNISIELAFYLNDDVNNMTDYEKVAQIAQTVQSLSKEVPIEAVHMDQEPSDPAQYDSLIRMLQLSAGIYKTTTTIKPLWLQQPLSAVLPHLSPETKEFVAQAQKQHEINTFADLVIYTTNSSSMMSYSNRYERILDMNEQYSTAAERIGRNGSIIIETGFINGLPAEETLCYEMKNDIGTFFDFVANVSAFHGNIVIHDYLQYYYDLYCTSPEHYVGAGSDVGTC